MATQNINIAISSTGGVTVIRNLQDIANAASSAVAPLKLLERTLKMTFAVLGVRQLAEWADAWTAASNKVNVFTKSQAETNVVIERLFDIAQKVRQPLNEMVTLYHRLSIGAKELGTSSNQNLKFTELVGKALAVQGTSAGQARGALVQLSQAMGMGRVRAQEWNSIIENLPLVLVTAAKHIDGMGGSVGKLRKLMLDKGLTSKMFFDAIMKGEAELDAMFEKTNKTFGQGIIVLVDGISRYLGKMNEAWGISNKFYSVTKFISTNMETIGKWAALVAVGVAGAFAPAIVTMFTGAVTAAAAALGRISMLLLANPFALIAVAVASVIAFGGAWDAGLDSMTTVKDVFLALVDVMTEFLSDFGWGLIGVWGSLVDAAQAAYETITANTSDSTSNWSDSYSQFFENTGTGFAGMLMKTAKVLDAIGGLITGLIIAAGRTIGGLPTIFANVFAMAYNSVAFWIANIVNVVINGLNRIRGMLGQELLQTIKIEQMKVDEQVFNKYGEHIAESINDGFDAQGGYMQKKVEELFGRAQLLANTRAKTVTTGNVNLDEFSATNPSSASAKAKKALNEADKAAKEYAKTMWDLHVQNLKVVEGYEDVVNALDKSNKAMQLETEMIGLSERAQLDLSQARNEAIILTKEQELASMKLGTTEMGFMSRREIALAEEIRLLKERNVLSEQKFERTAAADQAKKATDEWKKFYESIYNGLTDSLYRGFEAGKGFFDSFWTSIKNLFKTTVLKLAVQAVVGSVVGSLGISGLAQAAGISELPGVSSASGVGSLANLGSNIQSIYSTITSGFASLGNSVAFAAQDMGAWLVQNTTGVLNQAGGALMSNAGALGTAASYAGGAMAGYGIGTAISGKYAALGNKNTAVVLGTAIGAIWGPLGSAIGGAIGGLVNRAFGMGPKENTSVGMNGTLSAYGANVQTYSGWKQDGGWFRSDKSGYDYGSVGTEMQTLLTTVVKMTAKTTKEYADAIGLSGAAVYGYTQAINVSLKGLDAEGQQKAIGAALSGFADGMAGIFHLEGLAKAGETAGQTLARLATSLVSVNTMLAATNHTLMAISVAGADASSNLADNFGGLESMATAVQAYYDNFATADKKFADTVAAINKRVGDAGVNVFDASTGDVALYNHLVASQDLTTDSGRKAYAALISVAGAFKTVTDAIGTTTNALSSVEARRIYNEDDAARQKSLTREQESLNVQYARAAGLSNANELELLYATDGFSNAARGIYIFNRGLTELIKRVEDANAKIISTRTELIDAYKSEASALQATIDKFRGFATSLRELRNSLVLGQLSPLTPGQKYAEASSQFDQIRAATETGTTEQRAAAMEKMPEAANAFLEASKLYNASGPDYVRDYNIVQDALTRAADYANATADVAQLQLEVIKTSLTILGDISLNTLTIADRLKAYTDAQTAGIQAGASDIGPVITSTPTPTPFTGAARPTGGFAQWLGAASSATYGIHTDTTLPPGTYAAPTQNPYPQYPSSPQYPAFANGGWHDGGWAIVGENGAEAAYMPPSRIYTAADTAQMMGNTDPEVVNALNRIQAELTLLRQQQNGETTAIIKSNYDANAQNANAINTAKTRKAWSTEPAMI